MSPPVCACCVTFTGASCDWCVAASAEYYCYCYVWPTNEEAYAWAEPGRKKRALYNMRPREEAEKMKKIKTPSGAAGYSSTPITDETAAAVSSSYAGPALPIQL